MSSSSDCDFNFLRLEVDAATVAVAEIDRRALAGGLRNHRLEYAPIADDLVEACLPGLGLAGPVLLDGPSPIVGRAVVLPPILENAGHSLCCFAMARFGLVSDLLIDFDEVEFVGKLEAATPVPGWGRFVVGERLQRVGARHGRLRGLGLWGWSIFGRRVGRGGLVG